MVSFSTWSSNITFWNGVHHHSNQHGQKAHFCLNSIVIETSSVQKKAVWKSLFLILKFRDRKRYLWSALHIVSRKCCFYLLLKYASQQWPILFSNYRRSTYVAEDEQFLLGIISDTTSVKFAQLKDAGRHVWKIQPFWQFHGKTVRFIVRKKVLTLRRPEHNPRRHSDLKWRKLKNEPIIYI